VDAHRLLLFPTVITFSRSRYQRTLRYYIQGGDATTHVHVSVVRPPGRRICVDMNIFLHAARVHAVTFDIEIPVWRTRRVRRNSYRTRYSRPRRRTPLTMYVLVVGSPLNVVRSVRSIAGSVKM